MSAAEAHQDNVEGDLDDLLTDDDLEAEIELVSVLVVAATSSDRPLRQDEVDRLLGVDPKEDSADPKADGVDPKEDGVDPETGQSGRRV